MTYKDFWQPLTVRYDEGEAKAVARMVMELRYGLTMADILCGRVETLDHAGLTALQRRLLAGEPVQYVLGVADFGPRTFVVAPGVLIPRPETYELCRWVIESYSTVDHRISILDIGTGSGCIACTLAAELPSADVTAWDVSDAALAVARENVKRTGVHVSLEHRDIFSPPDDTVSWDVIVSNPPYVCEFEKQDMERHVLDHEPAEALFVPDDDPHRFYRAIARYARQAVRPQGSVFVECNPLFYDEQSSLLMDEGCFDKARVRRDQFGNYRFIKTCRETKE